MLTVLHEYTREALCVAVAAKMVAADVLEALYPLLLERGKPDYILSDNGPEFSAAPFKDWLRRVGIEPIRIYPGSRWENGYNERFNGTLRREVLNVEWFTTTRQAQIVIDTWLRQYNHIHPHHALGMRAPVPEAILERSQIRGPDAGSWAVAMVVATTSAPYVHPRESLCQAAHLLAEFNRVAVFQLPKLAACDLVHGSCVRPDTTQALQPGPRSGRWFEFDRVGAVGCVPNNAAAYGGIGSGHGFLD